MPSFTAQHVRQAFAEIQQNGIPEGFRPSTKWDIVDETTGERYPPKAVLFLAKSFAADKSYSGGGGDIGTNNALRKRGFIVNMKSQLDVSNEIGDIEDVLRSGVDTTTKKQLINARLGQGGFRAALIEIWSGKCALTALTFEPVLRASHIKSWRDSTNAERLDPYNGFLLAANVDALFDRHIISFDDEGRLLISSLLGQTALEKIGIDRSMRIDLKDENRAYLRRHMTRFYEEQKST
jgi:hypothetical protein